MRIGLSTVLAFVLLVAAGSSTYAESPEVKPLSLEATKALVAGVAFYPDETIEQILDASQYAESISAAAKANPSSAANQAWPASVQELFKQHEVLVQLENNPTMTARLSLAAKTQLEDVWKAVDAVRAEFEAQSATQAEGEAIAETSASGATASGVVYPVGAFAAGYWTAQTAQEIQSWYGTHVNYYATSGTTTYTGPNGNSATVSGSQAIGTATFGNTTYGEAAVEGSVSGPNGNTAHGQGQVAGSVTQTGNGAQYQDNASGSFSTSSGVHGQGTHSGQGGYSYNADGSVNFGSTGQSAISSTYGNAEVSHSGSGTYSGDGNGTYSGTASVDSTHGSIDTSTSVANGQASTTVTGGQGQQQTFTAGESQRLNNASSNTSKSGMQKSIGNPNFQSGWKMPADSSWGTKNSDGGRISLHANQLKRGQPKDSGFGRPNSGTSGSRKFSSSGYGRPGGSGVGSHANQRNFTTDTKNGRNLNNPSINTHEMKSHGRSGGHSSANGRRGGRR